jgi:hypothetical protein
MINVEENKVYVTVSVGPTFAIGVHRQYVVTHTNEKEDYTTTNTIIMIPFISLTIHQFKFPTDKSLKHKYDK